jgi:hypothetical protein
MADLASVYGVTGAENPRILMTFLAPARLAVHSQLSSHDRLS